MLVKDWLSAVKTADEIEIVVKNISEFGTKEYIIDKYGEFDLKCVEQHKDTGMLILYVHEYKKCSSYRTRTAKRHLSEYEQGYYFALCGTSLEYIDEEQPYCIATKECDACTCNGDRSKCNLYPQNKKI
jgi:hypothetical protein